MVPERSSVRLKSTEIDKQIAHRQHKFIQEKKPVEGVTSKRVRAHCHLQTGGFTGNEGPGKGGGNFSIETCLLSIARVSQGIGSCVLVRALGNRMFLSWTHGKNRTLLRAVKDLGLMFWYRCCEIRVSLGSPSVLEPNNPRVSRV
jgi:hypothetical protein